MAWPEPIPADDLPPELAIGEQPFADDMLDLAIGAGDGAEVPDFPVLEEISRWQVDDDETAEWALRKLRATADELDRRRLQKEAWQERIEEWWRRASKPLQARRDFFEGALRDYMRRRREADPQVKSVALPSGIIGSRASKAKLRVVDEEALISWAKANSLSSLVRVREEVNRSALPGLPFRDRDGRPVDPVTGEFVPGLVLEPSDVAYWVKPS